MALDGLVGPYEVYGIACYKHRILPLGLARVRVRAIGLLDRVL